MSDEAAAAAAKAVVDADAAGVARATALFAKTYDGARPTAAAAAPGRVNLIGEHTDYNDGWVFPLALEKSTYMVGARRAGGVGTKSRVVCEAFEGDVVEFDVAGDVAPLGGDRKWANYVVGMVAMYMRAAEKAGGEGIPAFDAAFVSDVPIGGGVSSSAALEVRVAGLTDERVARDVQMHEMYSGQARGAARSVELRAAGRLAVLHCRRPTGQPRALAEAVEGRHLRCRALGSQSLTRLFFLTYYLSSSPPILFVVVAPPCVFPMAYCRCPLAPSSKP